MFGLGWAFGLIGTSSLPSGVYIPAQYIFSIFIGGQGVLIFVLHTVRSADAREEWKRWWYMITCRADEYRILRTSSIIGTSTLKGSRASKTTKQVTTSSLTCPTDSFNFGSDEKNESKQPLAPTDEKQPDSIPLEETKLALDTIIENPLNAARTGEDGESEMREKEAGLSATNAVAISLDGEAEEDENTATEL